MSSEASSGVPLADIVYLQRGTTYKSALLDQPGPVLLGLASIQRNGGFRGDALRTYGGASPEKLVLRPGDLYVSLKDVTQSGDLLGAVARVPPDVTLGRLTQDTVKLIFRSDDTSHRYVYWILRTPQYREYCRSHAIGVTTLALPRGDFLSFRVPEPTVARLRALDALVALDDKIEHSRQLSSRLHKVSQGLFGALTTDAAPAELGTVAEVVDCLHSRKPLAQAPGRPLLQLENIRDDGLLDLSETYWISDADYGLWTRRMEARAGDCVITNVGRVGAASQVPTHVKAALGRNMTGLRCRSAYPFPTFLIESLLSPFVRREIEVLTDAGTVMDALNVRNIPRLKIPLPKHEALSSFESQARPLWAMRERLLLESQHLRSLRDALLPKLVSGEIRAPEGYEPPAEAAA